MDIDVEQMILEIQKRPALWDSSSELYKDKNNKREGWMEVCSCLFDNFDDESKDAKIVIEKAVISKWRTVRDGFVRTKKRDKELQKSGTGKKFLRKYVYADLLRFLELRETYEQTTTTAAAASVTSNTASSRTRSDAVVRLRSFTTAPPTEQTTSGRKRKRALPVEQDKLVLNSPHKSKCSDVTETQYAVCEDDEDMSFFKAMLPTVRGLDQARKFRFRMQLMGYLQSLVSETQQSGNCYSDPIPPACYPPTRIDPLPCQNPVTAHHRPTFQANATQLLSTATLNEPTSRTTQYSSHDFEIV